MVRRLRIAFVTPTFVTESNSGGMGTYLHRLTQALRELGHQPEVFTLTHEEPGTIEFESMRVERVRPARDLALRLICRLSRLNARTDISDVGERVRGALGLARAFKHRHRAEPFDFLQSSDYSLPGLFIKKDPGTRHLVRCSWAADLFIEADGRLDRLDSWLYCRLDRYCIQKADIAYAPSDFVAKYYKDEYGLRLEVLRPPVMLETAIASELPWELPQRYFMYFGSICSRKGTDVLAAALPLVWQQAPEFAMVWAGEAWDGSIEAYRPLWGGRASQVSWLGLIPKPQVYALLSRAEAVVVPSRVDNLPNTAIESLLLQVPVIGSLGASVDELVEPGISGELVPIGQPAALAEALVKAWRREVPWIGKPFRLPRIVDQMEPQVAAINLLRLAGYGADE